MTLLRYIRGPGLLLLETENSFHSCRVIVCVYFWYGCVCVCPHACYGLTASSAGAMEKQLLSDSITTASTAGGATRG